MSHFARKLKQSLSRRPKPQSWPLSINGSIQKIPIKYTRRTGSLALKHLVEGWCLYCPEKASLKKVEQMLTQSQADFERFIEQHSPAIQAKQQQATKQRQGLEFSWLGEKRLIDGALEQLEPQLIKEAEDYLLPKVRFYAKQMQLSPKQIKVKNYKSCWGNCYHQRGLVQFNWKLLQAPEWVVDYVIVHELAHLVHPNHSRDFWSLVQQHYPETPNAKVYLQQSGNQMMQFLAK
ncbi:M48 family metallopeptidase [Thiomicrorhabdus sp. 6S2-11]|uniref:M48 family metallopeptidase n=1 Tax=Thiomicrorhabdus marina TaxID=2818442 RepID=A0ABS3Q4D4_9GAMM|nr:M48 family metallopeptidase [Thiomicrorhabdus marina]MBO1927192.1 M48 family metallopeptidase [Thiomicrorhabdus marina]